MGHDMRNYTRGSSCTSSKDIFKMYCCFQYPLEVSIVSTILSLSYRASASNLHCDSMTVQAVTPTSHSQSSIKLKANANCPGWLSSLRGHRAEDWQKIPDTLEA